MIKSLPVACPWTVVLSGYSGFFHHQNWSAWYSWNIAESGIKHKKSRNSIFELGIGAHTLVSFIRFVARSQLPITTWPPRPYRVWYLILSLMSCILQEPDTQIYIFQKHHCLFSCSCHNIAEILLKLALNTNQSINLFILCWVCNLMVTNIKPDFFLIKHQK